MYIFPCRRIRYIKTITINTHIDCSNNSKCSVGDILKATKQGAFESVFGTFSVRRTKWLISLMHWAHDHQQCAEDPDHDDIANADEFKEALLVSAQRARLRKTDVEQVDTISKAVDPGKFKDLSMIPCVMGVPLSYVVRENAAPDHEMDFGNDFIACSIACSPLDDASFRANARKVHQLLINFLVAESVEQWIKDLAPRFNGRHNMEALRNH